MREGEEEIQSRVSERGVRKGAPVDRSLEKAPHSPAGSCSALVLLVQCWWNGCPPPLPQSTPTHVCPPTALNVLELRWQPGPQTPAYGGQTNGPALQCAPQLGIWWTGQFHATICLFLTIFTYKGKLPDWCKQTETWKNHVSSFPPYYEKEKKHIFSLASVDIWPDF